MKRFNPDEATLKKLEEIGVQQFVCDGCKVYIAKLAKIIMTDNKSRATWQVLLQKSPDSDIYMELFFDECYDYKNRKKGELNRSRAGNPYVGFLYCPIKSHPLDNKHFEQWKKGTTWRYPRLQECLRFMTGIFTDCGLSVEDFARGRVKYDDLVEYVKAWAAKTTVGHPYQIVASDGFITFGEDYTEDLVEDNPFGEDPFGAQCSMDDDMLPWN